MAIAATQVWNVQPGTGSDTYGGGFDSGVASPGTDYSQLSTPHVVFDGSTIAAHAAGVTATIIITGYTVSANDVGNTVQITGGSGFTAGFYTITAASVGSVTWTLDRNCTSGAASGMTGNMGGTLNTISKAVSVLIGGNIIYFKGTYTVSATTTLAVSIASGRPTTISGYTTTPGDGGQATWTTSTNSIELISFTQSNGYLIQNIIFSSTAGTPGSALRAVTTGNTTNVAVVNCKFTGCKYAINGDYTVDWAFVNLLVDSCELTTCTSDGIINQSFTVVLNSYIHGNTGIGINCGTAAGGNCSLTVIDSVIKGNAGVAGIQASGGSLQMPVVLRGCALINNTGDGIRMAGSSGLETLSMANCIIDSNGGYGVRYSIGNSYFYWGPNFRNNAYGSGGTANTSGDIGGSPAPSKAGSDITLTGDPFTSRSGNNFTLNNTAGAGAACRAAGYPGALVWGTSNTGYADIGPIQHQDAGGSAGMLYVPTMEGM